MLGLFNLSVGALLAWVTLLAALCAVGVAIKHAASPRRWSFIATLGIGCGAISLGLLGTVVGLIDVFARVAAVDPSTKSAVLSLGISDAMLSTAYGLGALPLWLTGIIVGALRRRSVTVAVSSAASSASCPSPSEGSISS